MEGCQHPHDDPLVIRVVVANKTIHRVLIDNGSSADIIFTSAFDKMGIGREKLEPVSTYLRGFSGERVLPLGSTQLVLHFGRPPMPGYDNSKVSHSRCPISLQYANGKALPQCHRGCSLCLSHGYQISKYKWSRNGPRKPAHSQGMLLSINETKHGRQHLHGRARHTRRGKHPTCSLRRIRACTAS